MAVSYSDAKENEITEVKISGKGMDKKLNVRYRDKKGLREYMI